MKVERRLQIVHISSHPLLHLKERFALKRLAKSGKEEREIPHLLYVRILTFEAKIKVLHSPIWACLDVGTGTYKKQLVSDSSFLDD